MEMHLELNRLRTYYLVPFLTAAEKVHLVKLNFYIKDCDNENSVCYKCNLTQKTRSPEIKMHKCCPVEFIKNVPISSPYTGNIEINFMSDLRHPEMRLATYSSWSYSNNNEMMVKVADLANAGFFYAQKPFSVQCYYCGQRLTVYVCELLNCIDFRIPNKLSEDHCRHTAPLKLLTKGLMSYELSDDILNKKRLCRLCAKYKPITFQPYYHVESCFKCSQHLKALLSPSLLPSYKVSFNNGRIPRARRLSCHSHIN